MAAGARLLHRGFESGIQFHERGRVVDAFDSEHGHGDAAGGVGVLREAGQRCRVGPVAQHTGVQCCIVIRTPVAHAFVAKGAGAPGAVLHHVAEVERRPIHVALDGAGRNADDVGDHLHAALLLGRAGRCGLVQPQAFVHARSQVGLGQGRISGQADVERVLHLSGPGVVVAEVLVDHAQVGAKVVRA